MAPFSQKMTELTDRTIRVQKRLGSALYSGEVSCQLLTEIVEAEVAMDTELTPLDERIQQTLSIFGPTRISLSENLAESIVGLMTTLKKPIIAVPYTYLDKGRSVSEPTRRAAWRLYHEMYPMSDVPYGRKLMNIYDEQSLLDAQGMLDRSDQRFKHSYYLAMSGYDCMDSRTCKSCGEPIRFFYDLRRLSGASYCPACFPSAAKENAAKSRKGDIESKYHLRVADLLPDKRVKLYA